jgi:RHS repeat-associated protein
VFGFTGNLTDAITGLLYLRARDYDPATGQFLTVDPALDSTHQPYAYAGNDPVLNTDPTGLDFLSDVGDNALAFGAGVLDDLTWGVSGAVLSQMVPGYDCFVENHQAAFTAGVVVSQGVQLAVMILGTAGVGTGLAVGMFILKTAVKDGLKVAAKVTTKLLAKGAKTMLKSTLKASKSIGSDVKGFVKKAFSGGKGCNSFVAGTPVLMADGSTKPIEDVAVGDQVLATDPESGESGARSVAALIRHGGEHAMADVSLSDGTVVYATAGHPFWDVSAGAFVIAGALPVGDEVLTAGGARLSVTAVVLHEQDLTAYNLSIDGIHTYYAGDAAVLVHNTGAACDLNVASDARTQHILNGDATGGGHLFPGEPGKTPFPESWSAGEVMSAISEVATNPNSKIVAEQGVRTVLNGEVDGVLIKVVTDWRDIITAYPLY